MLQVVIWLAFLVSFQEELLRLRHSAAVIAADSSAPILASGTAVIPPPFPMMYVVLAVVMALTGIILGKFMLWMSTYSSTIQQICESVCVCRSPTFLPFKSMLYFHFLCPSFFRSHASHHVSLFQVTDISYHTHVLVLYITLLLVLGFCVWREEAGFGERIFNTCLQAKTLCHSKVSHTFDYVNFV